MLSHGPLVQFALLAGLVLAMTLALLVFVGENPLRRLLLAKSPAMRARILWWVLVSPTLAGVSYTALTIAMPSVLHNSTRFAAACSAHAQSFWHLCLWHPGEGGQSLLLWVALALFGACVILLGLHASAGVWRGRHSFAAMLRLGRRADDSGRLYILQAEQPLALAYGIWRGRILLSSALLERLDPLQLRVVLAHEQAHLTHRDALYRLLAMLLSCIQFPGTRRRLLRDLDLAQEQRCDLVAAEAVAGGLSEVGLIDCCKADIGGPSFTSDKRCHHPQAMTSMDSPPLSLATVDDVQKTASPILVAETIMAVERVFIGHAAGGSSLAMTFSGSFVPERVRALLAPAGDSAPWLGRGLAAALVLFCVLSVGWLHHFTEALMSLLVG